MMFTRRKKPSSAPVIIFFAFLLLMAGLGYGAYRWITSLSPTEILQSRFVQNIVESHVPKEAASFLPLAPTLAGLDEPITYLLLFLNNTEMRPGGGFIGAYAVATVSQGNVTLHVVEGSEVLDWQTPESWKPEPPAIVKEKLGVDRWYFRDSNWSPDFVRSAQQTLAFYKGEGGIHADDIDVVVGVTPTVLEEILAITGPISVDGIVFEPETATEKLQYEVEYAYVDRGIAVEDRKAIMHDFFYALIGRVRDSGLMYFDELTQSGLAMIEQKQVMAYAKDPLLQTSFGALGLTGEVEAVAGDSLQWVDANLAALKTDHAMERAITYKVTPREDGRHVATVTMTYDHRGTFDWRTSRYLSYARVYVPFGSELVSHGGSLATNPLDFGHDLGKTWFGTFVRIEPGETETLSFTYVLPQQISRAADAGMYTLLVQKQLGSKPHKLTLDLDFGTTITTASPAEEAEEWYDTHYRMQTDLLVDRAFSIGL